MTKRLNLFFVGLIILSISYLAMNFLQEGEFSPKSDEGHYYFFAQQVAHHGLNAFGGLIDHYFTNPKSQFYPPPTRIGYVLTSAMLWRWYPGYWILGFFSFICFVLFLMVNLKYCRRYFGDKAALLSTVLLASSPLLLAMSRRALIESVVNLLSSLAVWLFLDYLVLRKKKTYVFFLVVLALSLMFKESAVILFPFFILMGWFFPGERKLGPWEFVGLISAGLIGGMVIPGLVVGWARWFWGMDILFHLQHTVFLVNPYVAKYCGGPWYRYLIDFMLLSPMTLLLFIGYIFYLLARSKNDFNTKYLFSYFFITYLLMVPLQKNIRYVVNLEMVVAIFAVLMIIELARKFFSPSWQERGVALMVGLIFFFDYLSFIKIFVMGRLLDPITSNLLYFRGIHLWY